MTRILVVDDHAILRRGVAIMLEREPSVVAVWEASTAGEAVEIASRESIDVATVDILMPHVSGISLISQLHELQPSCRVLVLSMIDDPDLISDVMRAGACGFVTKAEPIQIIVSAIHAAARGERYLPPGISTEAIDTALLHDVRNGVPRMTKREHEVFELVIGGLGNAAIAAHLAISPRTVEAHRQRVSRKVSARSLIQLQRLAARHASDG